MHTYVAMFTFVFKANISLFVSFVHIYIQLLGEWNTSFKNIGQL